MKELPKMYHNKINKIGNVQKIYSTIGNFDGDIDDNREYSHVSVDEKINRIFSSNGFVYKADVVIVTNDGSFRKRVVARNRNNLITIDNEYIPISVILDIYE